MGFYIAGPGLGLISRPDAWARPGPRPRISTLGLVRSNPKPDAARGMARYRRERGYGDLVGKEYP